MEKNEIEENPCNTENDDGEFQPFNFQTVPMESREESTEEKLSRIERLLEEILERTSESDDTRAIYEDMVNFYNSFDSKTKTLTEKLEKEVEYTRFIETQITSKSMEKECLMLKKALVEERALMGLKFDEMKASFDEKMRQIESETKIAQERQGENLAEISKQVKAFSDIDTKITDKLDTFRKDMTKASTNEYNILQAQCKESLSAANGEFDSIKKNVISFLKNCEKQNDSLIRKIPEQKIKFCWKDAVIYAMSALCITVMVVQIFLRV